MAAPLSGVGQQQQIAPVQPVSNSLDQTRQIRQKEQDPRENELQTRGAATAQSQNTSDTKEDVAAFQKQQDDAIKSLSQQSNNNSPAPARGTVVDLVV